MRLDQAIARTLSASGEPVSTREIRQALKNRKILVDQSVAKPGDRAQGKEQLDLTAFTSRNQMQVLPAPELLRHVTILYEDERILVLDKPSGHHCLPHEHLEASTLLGAAIAHAPEIAKAGPPLEGGAVHRLDHGTSGVLMFAKDEATRNEFRTAFRTHQIEKEYLLVVSDPDDLWAQPRTLEVPLDTTSAVVRTTNEGLSASTHVMRVKKSSGPNCLLQATTQTGRRHQVRVHLAHVGTPILGDSVYGQASTAPRLALHASRLKLPNGRVICASLPEALEGMLH